MRLLLLLAALLVAPAVHAQSRDWRQTVTETRDGAYVVGNPAAKVRLVEYLSYTCPHCAHFTEESKAELIDGYVRRGSVRVEFRHAIRDGLDLAATLLARCGGPQRFLPTTEAIFSAQEQWTEKAIGFQQDNAGRLSLYPAAEQGAAIVDASGLRAFAPVDKARADACLANDAQKQKLAAMASKSWSEISGTPSFLVNGVKVMTDRWGELKAKLVAAGAK